MPCWALRCYGHTSVCKKSLPGTSLCHHSSEHRRRQSSCQIIWLQVSCTHHCHRSQSACIGMQSLHLSVCSTWQYMLTSLQTPSARLSSLLLQWTFTLGTTGKTQMVTQFRCVCIKPCLHNEHAFMALYSCHMPLTLTDACICSYYTVIPYPAP